MNSPREGSCISECRLRQLSPCIQPPFSSTMIIVSVLDMVIEGEDPCDRGSPSILHPSIIARVMQIYRLSSIFIWMTRTAWMAILMPDMTLALSHIHKTGSVYAVAYLLHLTTTPGRPHGTPYTFGLGSHEKLLSITRWVHCLRGSPSDRHTRAAVCVRIGLSV